MLTDYKLSDSCIRNLMTAMIADNPCLLQAEHKDEFDKTWSMVKAEYIKEITKSYQSPMFSYNTDRELVFTATSTVNIHHLNKVPSTVSKLTLDELPDGHPVKDIVIAELDRQIAITGNLNTTVELKESLDKKDEYVLIFHDNFPDGLIKENEIDHPE